MNLIVVANYDCKQAIEILGGAGKEGKAKPQRLGAAAH